MLSFFCLILLIIDLRSSVWAGKIGENLEEPAFLMSFEVQVFDSLSRGGDAVGEDNGVGSK